MVAFNPMDAISFVVMVPFNPMDAIVLSTDNTLTLRPHFAPSKQSHSHSSSSQLHSEFSNSHQSFNRNRATTDFPITTMTKSSRRKIERESVPFIQPEPLVGFNWMKPGQHFDAGVKSKVQYSRSEEVPFKCHWQAVEWEAVNVNQCYTLFPCPTDRGQIYTRQ
ncbi:hypothetical protein AAHA92_11854 [Salvia divinorum]|uniref:Uncharacterized protein n=1 Tax=Salvia divinorum TaxID=28513 RepID=A0ABD1HID3_SALDI